MGNDSPYKSLLMNPPRHRLPLPLLPVPPRQSTTYGAAGNAGANVSSARAGMKREAVIVFRRVDGASAFPAQHVRYIRTKGRGREGTSGLSLSLSLSRARARACAALLHGILISVNYSREWHVLLTSALSSRRSGRIQFSRPSARSTGCLSPTALRGPLAARGERVTAGRYLERKED